MLQKKFYNIEEMSVLLGKTISSIYGHLARRDFHAVPPPMKLGRRLAWAVSSVESWVDEKMKEVEEERKAYERQFAVGIRKRGRPRKTEARKRGQVLVNQ